MIQHAKTKPEKNHENQGSLGLDISMLNERKRPYGTYKFKYFMVK